jgi:putative transcriptional regulator
MSNFSKKIISLRKEKGLTQKDIAIALNRKQSTISMWETGVNIPLITEVVKLAEYLQVTPQELTELIIQDIYEENRLRNA